MKTALEYAVRWDYNQAYIVELTKADARYWFGKENGRRTSGRVAELLFRAPTKAQAERALAAYKVQTEASHDALAALHRAWTDAEHKAETAALDAMRAAGAHQEGDA